MIRRTLQSLALTAMSLPALAAPDQTYLGMQGTYHIYDEDRLTDDGLGLQMLLGRSLGSHLAGELNGFASRGQSAAGARSNAQYGIGLDLLVYPLGRSTAVVPFAATGFGAQYDDRPAEAGAHLLANLGGGVLVPLSARTSLRLDARRYLLADDGLAGNQRLWDSRVGAGVQFLLDEPALARSPVLPTPPAPPPLPPPPVDSDSDGVPDERDRCPGSMSGVLVDALGCAVLQPLPRPDSDQDGIPDAQDACPDTPLGLQVDARGCAVRTARIALNDIGFQPASSVLTPVARQALWRIAEGLHGQPGMELVIEGHTDSTGSESSNLRLSLQRAESVRRYLIGEGIEGRRLTARGAGESRPITSNSTPQGRALNRRVEFSVAGQ